MTENTKLAVACFNCRNGKAEWDSAWLKKAEEFLPGSMEAASWKCRIHQWESSEYTSGMIWEAIPHTEEALERFARENQRYIW